MGKNISKVVCMLISIDAFLGMHVLFVNKTFNNAGYYLQLCIDLFTVLILGIYLFVYKMRYSLSVEKIIIIFSIIIFFLYMGLNYYERTSITVRTTIAMIKLLMIFFLSDKELLKVLDILTKIFALSLLPCIVIYLLTSFGVEIPYRIIEPTADGQLYLTYYDYYGCLIINEDDKYWRLCGLFNEPGVLGTIGGWLLCKEGYQIKKWYNAVIFIAGIMSFSTAFIIITILYFIMKLLILNPNIKKISIVFIVSVLVAVLDGVLCQISIEYMQFFHNKIIRLIFEGKSNRNRVDFDLAIKNLWNGFKWIFGNGGGAEDEMFGVLSIKGFFYDYGLMGLIIFGIMLMAIYLSIKPRKDESVCLFFIYIISLYQRPYTTSFFAILILYSGLIYTEKKIPTKEKIIMNRILGEK